MQNILSYTVLCLALAFAKYGINISPVLNPKTNKPYERFEDCLEIFEDKAILFFNTGDHSTHIVVLKIDHDIQNI